jgi:hypothetical protein
MGFSTLFATHFYDHYFLINHHKNGNRNEKCRKKNGEKKNIFNCKQIWLNCSVIHPNDPQPFSK